MRRSFLCVLLVLGIAILNFAQQPNQPPAWNVTLQPNASASSNLSVVNQCRSSHNFQIQRQNVPFLNISQNQVQVNGNQTVNIPVQFNTQNLTVGVHQGQVLVVCLTCRSEPTCLQDREVLQVVLNVANPTGNPPNNQPQNPPGNTRTENAPNPTSPNWPAGVLIEKIPRVAAVYNQFMTGPCPDKEKGCEKLRQIAAELEAAATDAQKKADDAKKAADDAEAEAKAAEAAASSSSTAAQPAGSAYGATVNGQEYSSADIAYLEKLRKENNDNLKSGKITREEHQRRAKELTAKKAREERLANEAKLKSEAEAAKAAAEKARAAANDAKAKADAAQKAADAARKAADEALEAYKKCLKELEDKCRREAEAKAAADQKKKDDEARAAATRAADEIRRKEKEAADKTRAAENTYLLDNIKRLGLISSAPFKDIPGAFDAVVDKIIPDILGKTAEQWVAEMASQAAEGVSGTPIPISSIQAIGGLYQVAAALLDPCTQAGKRKTVERLQGMINPKTDRKYTLDEALDKTDRMCNLLNELKAKLAAIKKLQGK